MFHCVPVVPCCTGKPWVTGQWPLGRLAVLHHVVPDKPGDCVSWPWEGWLFYIYCTHVVVGKPGNSWPLGRLAVLYIVQVQILIIGGGSPFDSNSSPHLN